MGFCLCQEFCSCIYICIYFFRVLGYRTIDSKVCQENRVGKRKSLTTIYWRISCLWYSGIHLLASVCSARKSQSTEWKWMPLLWFVLIRSVKRGDWPYFFDCIYVSIPAPLRFGHLCNWETRQPWTGNPCEFSFFWLKIPMQSPVFGRILFTL